jgi:hypothetical protein
VVELRAGIPGRPGRAWRNPLRIDATVDHTGSRRPNKAKITVHNLSEDSVEWLEQPGMTVQLLAGAGVVGELFRGDLTGRGDVRSELRPGGRMTVLEPQDGRRQWLTSTISRSYPPGTTRTQLLTDAIAALGYARGYISTQLPPRAQATGYVWQGYARDMVDDLVLGTGASWTHRDGAIHITMPGEQIPGNTPSLSAGTGLIGIPTRKGKSVKFKSKFDPALKPASGVLLASSAANGLYRMTKVTHNVSSMGTIWTSDCEAVEP